MNICLYSVYRDANGRDYSCHGLSSYVPAANLFWDCTREEAIAYCEERNIDTTLQFYLVDRTLWGEDHSYAEPLIKPEGMAQTFGGNFLYTSNGNGYKFKGEKTGRPIHIHDRFETWEVFHSMSI